MATAEVSDQAHLEMERMAAQKARDRARAARWDLDVAVFFFSILIIVLVLLFQDVGLEIVAPSAIAGLALGWLMGWKKGQLLYDGFYNEELLKLLRESQRVAGKDMEETIEEKVQRALRERWR